MESVMAKRLKRQAVPSEMLSKEFLSQFKSEEDVSQFLKDLHAQVLEQMLQGEMDAHLGYEKHSSDGNNSGNSRNGSYSKKIQTEHGESIIEIPRDRNGEFEPVVIPKHQSRGLSIERLVISLYAKGMSVSDIVVNSEHTHPEKRPPFRGITTQNTSIFIEKGVRIREIAQVFRSNATQPLSIAF